eukprot:EG_transcript_18679
MLGNYKLGDDVLTYDELRLQLDSPPLPEADGFHRVKELDKLCHACPLDVSTPSLCPGLWLAADIRRYLMHALKSYGRPGPGADIAIQFRCSDSHKFGTMGLFSFHYYHFILAPHVSTESHISILPDVFHLESPCCSALSLALAEALRAAFHCTVEVLVPSKVPNDLAFFIHARIFIGSASTFGLFAAIASQGRAFLPISKTLFLSGNPCLEHVQWVSSPVYLKGCRTPIFRWFFNSSFHGLEQHFHRVFDGPWFGGRTVMPKIRLKKAGHVDSNNPRR